MGFSFFVDFAGQFISSSGEKTWFILCCCLLLRRCSELLVISVHKKKTKGGMIMEREREGGKVVGFPVDEFGWVTRQFMTVVIREKVENMKFQSFLVSDACQLFIKMSEPKTY